MRYLRYALFALLLVCLQRTASAQAAGLYAFGPFDTPGFDTINRGNLNTHFSIPIFSKQGRGGSNFVYSLNYDGLVWVAKGSGTDQTWTPVPSWGWTDVTNAQWGYVTYDSGTYSCTVPPKGIEEIYFATSNYVFHDAHGGSHKIPFTYTGTCGGSATPTGTSTYVMNDNSGYTIYRTNNSFVVFDQYGAQYAVPSYITFNGYGEQTKLGAATFTDTNGNQISASSSGLFTDTTGTTVLKVTGAAPNPVVYTYTDPAGHSQTVTVNYTLNTVATNFGNSSITDYDQPNIPLVSSIVYSGDGSSYSFTYEQTPGNSSAVTGRIETITLRTGGTITYAYGSGIEPDGTPVELSRTTSDGPTTYTRSAVTTTSSTTTYTDASSTPNTKVYTFLESSLGYVYETSRSIYQGTATGTPLQQVTTCYVAPSGCASDSVEAPISYVGTTLVQNGITVGTDIKQYSSGLLTSDYDGYVTETTAYQTFTGPDSIPFSRVSSVTDTIGGVQVGQTGYSYDDGTPTPTSGLSSHAAVTTSRGNLTTVSPWLSTTNATFGATTIAYYDTGSPISSTTPNGKTTYTYESTNTFVDTLTLPTPASEVALKIGATFDTTNTTGVPLTSVDPNSNTTTYKTYNGMLQPLEVDYPDTGKTTYTYDSPNQTSIYLYQTSSGYSDIEKLLDGYGRPSRAAVGNGQSTNPWYQQDTCYNSNGQVDFVSYPYQGTGWGTGGTAQVCANAGDAYVYDALGRATSITHGDGTKIGYQYNGRATQVTDENGVVRISQYDGHGRITSLCEVTGSSLTLEGEKTVNCGQDIAATGFLTTYAYTTASNGNQITTITQGVQTRQTTVDSLGRTVSTTEPERGVTTYGYAYNSTGLQISRNRPTANQSSSSTLTTTWMQYDAVGRIKSITYSDGTTGKAFGYDTSAGWSDLAQNNLIGRLSQAVAGSATTIYGYDAMGRITDLDECVPSGCGTTTYNKKLHYTYDLAGDMLSSTDGAGVQSTYGVTPAGELQSLTSSLSNSTNPANLISNVVGGPNGPVQFDIGNGLSKLIAYSSLGRTQGGWLCNGGNYSVGCKGGTQFQGFYLTWTANRPNFIVDSIQGNTSNVGYDQFGRLNSLSGSQPNFSYTYDRYGNRWAQTLTAGSGSYPQPSLSFNTANNHISTAGYAYDAAGNMTSDGTHTYTYDAEGNITQVDSGSTAQYVYNALNQRVRTVVGSTATEFIFNANGQRVSIWNGSTHAQLQGQYYWGRTPVAFYQGGLTHFQHQDWLGTERLRTTYNGSVEGKYTSLPFGDGQGTITGTDGDAYHFAQTDTDSETGSDHAQFRQYSSTQGRWMVPDPYNGSYDPSNPQSFNRYAYALNNPLGATDPSGLILCDYGPSDNGGEDYEDADDASECTSNGGSVGNDGTSITVNGDNPDDPGTTTENGTQIYPVNTSGGAPNNNPCSGAGNAPNPSYYANMGAADKNNPFTSTAHILGGFQEGGSNDAQPAGGSRYYGNYVYGAYMQQAGFPLSISLIGANEYSVFSGISRSLRGLGPKYDPSLLQDASPWAPAIPRDNVTAITQGFSDAKNGTLCHK